MTPRMEVKEKAAVVGAMNKLFKVVNIELRLDGQVNLCLDDYRPDMEQVDPAKEKIAQVAKQMQEAGMPKEVTGMFESLGSLSSLPGLGDPHLPGHREVAKLTISTKDYETLGRPTVGDIIEANFAIGKAPEDEK